MKLEWVPLLEVQRELQRLPRGMERFREYLRVMLNEDGDDLRLPPLVAMNPLGRDHVTAVVDALLALDAEAVARDALAQATSRVADVPGEYQLGFAVADDVMGGWTNRCASEFALLAANQATLKRGWLTVVLWASETPTARMVRESVLTVVYRTAYLHRHGRARTLLEMMAQEGEALALAGCTEPSLDADDREYTREVIAPFLDADDMRTAIECLYGDAAGRTLGFTPRGLSHRAGLALALHDARMKT